MPTLKDLWTTKWFRYATIAAALLITVSLFGNFRSCRSVDYWKGQAAAAEARVKNLGYTIESLEKATAAMAEENQKEIATLRGMVDSANTVAAGAHAQAEAGESRIADLEKELAAAGTLEERYRIVQAQNVELKRVVEVQKTEIAAKNRIIELKDAEIGVKDRAYSELKLNYDKGIEGWRAEKARADALEKVNVALGQKVTALKLQAFLGKAGAVGLLALGIYAVAK